VTPEREVLKVRLDQSKDYLLCQVYRVYSAHLVIRVLQAEMELQRRMAVKVELHVYSAFLKLDYYFCLIKRQLQKSFWAARSTKKIKHTSQIESSVS